MDPQDEVLNRYPIRRVGIPCRAQSADKQRTRLAKMKIARDEARVRSCSKKESKKRSTIRCFRHPGQTTTATNQRHNSRARATVIPAAAVPATIAI